MNFFLIAQLASSKLLDKFPKFMVAKEGSCRADTSFRINSIQDLTNNVQNLECVFQAGVPLKQPPLGAMYGTLLLVANTTIPSKLGNILYEGDIAYETACKSDNGVWEEFNMSQLRLAPGFKLGISRNTVSTYPVNLAHGENPYSPNRQVYKNGEEALVMDFTFSSNSICDIDFGTSPLKKLKT